MDKEQLEEDFDLLREHEEIKSVLVFGSQVTGETHERSDIDICVVAPGNPPSDTMSLVWRKPELQKQKYDIHAFEELSLRLKMKVVENHEVIWKRDDFSLQEYFYRYRKIWNDQSKARGVA